jgi:poly-gamma-glutamate synthesis protein (capsule biosynthesis protein)
MPVCPVWVALWRRAVVGLARLPVALALVVVLTMSAPQPEEATAPCMARPVTVALAGDVMLGRGVASALQGRWKLALSDVSHWLRPQYAIANLESPLTSHPQRVAGHDLRAPPLAVDVIRFGAIDIATLANNHANDAGVAGMLETRAVLAAAGVEAVGAGEPRLFGSGGDAWAFALIALDESGGPLNLREAGDLVRAYAAMGVPVVVSMHWGGEFQAEPSQRQRLVARVLVSAGADVVFGHGPHVLQAIERVGDAVVAYSLGNLLSDQLYPVDGRWGAIMRLSLVDCRAADLEIVPTVTAKGRTRVAIGGEAEDIRDRLGLSHDVVAAPSSAAMPRRDAGRSTS